MEDNVLVIHGGGPTPVINASLYGVIEQAVESGGIGKVYGALGGTKGVLEEDFLDLLRVPEDSGHRLLRSALHGSPWRMEIMRRCRAYSENMG